MHTKTFIHNTKNQQHRNLNKKFKKTQKPKNQTNQTEVMHLKNEYAQLS